LRGSRSFIEARCFTSAEDPLAPATRARLRIAHAPQRVRINRDREMTAIDVAEPARELDGRLRVAVRERCA
jgi:hypothetical protein